MQYKYAEIADVIYFWFAANLTTGAAGDGATPLYDVRLAGAAADAAPTASGTPTLLSHVDYPDGLYEIAINTTGYSTGEYAVFCTLTISTVNPAGFCGSFKLRAAGTGALKIEIARPTGVIVDDANNSTTVFKTNLTSAESDYIKDAFVKFTSGDNVNQVKKVMAYDGISKVITTAAFTDKPLANDTFVIVNE